MAFFLGNSYLKKNFCLTAFVLISNLCFAHNWEVDLLQKINVERNTSLDALFIIVTNFAAPIAYSVPIFIFFYAYFGRNSSLKERSAYVILTTLFAAIIATTLKHIVNRPRPFDVYSFIQENSSGGSPSFPSGHTCDAFTLATTLSIAFPKGYIVIPAFAWAIAVGYSRMHLGVHYPTDVLGSIILSLMSSYAGFLIMKQKGYFGKK